MSKKPMKKEAKSITDERTPQERFDETKNGLLMIAKSIEKNAMRPDKVVADWNVCHQLLGDHNPVHAIKICRVRKKTCSDIIDRLEALTMDKLMEDGYDPFEDMISYVEDSDDGYTVLAKAGEFDILSNFGGKVENLKFSLKIQLENAK